MRSINPILSRYENVVYIHSLGSHGKVFTNSECGFFVGKLNTSRTQGYFASLKSFYECSALFLSRQMFLAGSLGVQ